MEEAGATRSRRLRRWLGLAAEPRPRLPAVRRVRRIRSPWVLAVLHARTAVLGRVPLEEYLRARLATHLIRLPVPRSRLPLRIEVTRGEIVAARWSASPEAGSPGAEPSTAALVALEGPSVLRETAALEARLTALEAERDTAHRRLVERSRQLEDDLSAGRLAPAPPPEHSPEQLGRPSVPSSAPQIGLGLLALGAVLANAWSIAVPALAAAGRYPLPADGWSDPEVLAAGFTSAFAVGVSVGLLLLASAALRSADEFAQAVGAPGRRRAQVTALLAGAAAAAIAAGAVALPAPRSGFPPRSHAVLLLSLSAGAALLLRRVRRLRDERSVGQAAALAWDRERARILSERARRLEELAWAEEEVRELDRRRARARARLDELTRRSEAAARLVARAEELQRADLDRLAQSLVGALERDRYEYLRQAAARGAVDLLPAPWKPEPEAQPAGSQDLPAPASGRMAG